MPANCVFRTFYGEDGYLKREIFIESAGKTARIFENEGMTQTSFRSLFNMLKSMEQRLKAGKIPQGEVDEAFLDFIRQVEYKTNREVLKSDIFRKFVNAHKDIVLGNEKEFKGFVEYLTSILAYMKPK